MDFINSNTSCNIDITYLKNLGFTDIEIQQHNYILNNNGKFTIPTLQQYGLTNEQAKRISYLHNICLGKISVNTEQEMIRHLRRLNNNQYKIGIQDLAVSKISTVPRIAIVSNIDVEPYSIWNSNRYKGNNMLYRVIDVTTQKITIETARKPKLEKEKPLAIPGVLEIKGVRANGNAVITFDKKYCTLCNRFVIVASLRRPEYHHGLYEIVCFEGTKAYVFASTLQSTRDSVKYNMGTQRIYAYGIFPNDIKLKLSDVAKSMYQHLSGVSVQMEGSTQEYYVIDKEKRTDSFETGVFL